VQIAVSATNVSCAVLETRKFPADDCTSAAPPTFASGEAASTVTVTAPFANDPLTVVSCGAFDDGLLGLLLLPHPGSTAPSAATDAA